MLRDIGRVLADKLFNRLKNIRCYTVHHQFAIAPRYSLPMSHFKLKEGGANSTNLIALLTETAACCEGPYDRPSEQTIF
jgi:hypothetical protein